MQLIQEKLDKDFFIDVVLSLDEINDLAHGAMLSLEFFVGKEMVFLGLRKPISGEENAAHKVKVKKSYR